MVWWVMVVTAAIGIISAAFTFREMQNPLLLIPVAAERLLVLQSLVSDQAIRWVGCFLGLAPYQG